MQGMYCNHDLKDVSSSRSIDRWEGLDIIKLARNFSTGRRSSVPTTSARREMVGAFQVVSRFVSYFGCTHVVSSKTIRPPTLLPRSSVSRVEKLYMGLLDVDNR